MTDTYQLYTDNMEDLNRVFIIFSVIPINKPRLKEDLNTNILTEKEKQQGFTVPRSLKSEEFQKWLNKNRSYLRNKMHVKIIDISITKK